MKRNTKLFLLVAIFLLLIFFGALAYYSSIFVDFSLRVIDEGVVGVIIYVLILVFATIFAPISVTPLIPFAAVIFGFFPVVILTVIGETIGALIAFCIARKYGYPIVKKRVSVKNIHKYERLVPEKNLFLGIILLRIAIPFDFMSYILGLSGKVNLRIFISASVISFVPYAFVVAYLGFLPLHYLFLTFIFGILLFGLVIFLGLLERKKFKEKFEGWRKRNFLSNK